MTAAREALEAAVRWAASQGLAMKCTCSPPRDRESPHQMGCWVPLALAALGEGAREGR